MLVERLTIRLGRMGDSVVVGLENTSGCEGLEIGIAVDGTVTFVLEDDKDKLVEPLAGGGSGDAREGKSEGKKRTNQHDTPNL
jgi:hypothetical protein